VTKQTTVARRGIRSL